MCQSEPEVVAVWLKKRKFPHECITGHISGPYLLTVPERLTVVWSRSEWRPAHLLHRVRPWSLPRILFLSAAPGCWTFRHPGLAAHFKASLSAPWRDNHFRQKPPSADLSSSNQPQIERLSVDPSPDEPVFHRHGWNNLCVYPVLCGILFILYSYFYILYFLHIVLLPCDPLSRSVCFMSYLRCILLFSACSRFSKRYRFVLCCGNRCVYLIWRRHEWHSVTRAQNRDFIYVRLMV